MIGLSPVGKAVPCAFCLLPDKEKTTYVRVAECLQKQLQEGEEEVRVHTVMQDYEKGANTAFRTTFDGVKIDGCQFHWKSALKKR